MSFSHWLDRIQARIKNSSCGKVAQKRRSHARIRLNRLPSLTERLEDRTLLSAVVFDAAAATENLRLSLDGSGNVQIAEEGNVVFSQPVASVDNLTINGNQLDNLLTVDTSNGNPIPSGGLFYNGLDEQTETGDGLAIVGNGISSATTYQPTDLEDGVLTVDDRVINFTGLEPVLDNNPTVLLIINGTGDANTYSYTAGSNGFFTGPSALVAADAFETIEFNNKTEITINSLAGNDVFNFNNNTTPAGLTTGINLNGGDDDDTFNLLSGASVPLFIDGEAGTDSVQVAGASTGSISVADLTIAAESIGFDINGTTPGTQYDQLVSSGTVDISGVTLSFAGTLSPASGQSFTSIETVGGVIGTFAGLAEGATISNFLGSGLDATISYLGGDGDDAVVMVNDSNELNASIDGGGNLVLNESGRNSLDVLTISTDGTIVTISDANNRLGTGGIAGATGDGTTTITIPLASFAGGIIINSMGNDDSLTVDFGGGANFDRTIDFNGGMGSDSLEVLNGMATDVIHTFANSSDGSITIDTFGLSYTGLEPILDTITATTRTFAFAGTDDDITLADLGGGMSRISSVSSSETVDFTNPTGSLTINAGDGMDTVDASASIVSVMINGNMGNDELTGGTANDTIMGGGGDDLMDGGAGMDMLTGQAGNDTMTGGLGDDTLNGGADTDQIVESRDANFDLGDATLTISPTETDTLVDVEEADLTGGASANIIDASDFSGTATLMGGDNDDTITGAMGESAINGNMGNDELTGLGSNDTIMGGGGDDLMDGGAGMDMLTGQAGNDTMTGGLGDSDTIMGGTGNDTINGGTGNDTINGGAGDDSIMGGDDNDLINGSLGNDTISGDAGDDRIQGSNLSDYPPNPQMPIGDLATINMSDMDSLLGGSGSDTIAGAIGADFIDGEGDADIIDAQSGGDTTDGIDTIVGGAGDIIFRDPEDTLL
jgi:hypothetical protein